MKPDEFFRKHPSLKDELSKATLSKWPGLREDIARTQTDNAIINYVLMSVYDKHHKKWEEIGGTRIRETLALDNALEDVEKSLLGRKDAPSVVRVDDLKRAIAKAWTLVHIDGPVENNQGIITALEFLEKELGLEDE